MDLVRSGVVTVRSLAPLVMLLGACYTELGVGYYPSLRETVSPPGEPVRVTEGAGLSAMFKLGFYLDVPLRPLRTAIGVGLAPEGAATDAVLGADAESDAGAKGTELRLDVSLPVVWRGVVTPRLTIAHLGVGAASVKQAPGTDYVETEATGSTWFVGGTLSTRVARGTLVQLSAGVQRQRLTAEATSGSDGTVVPVELAATGAALRFMFTWTPTGAFLRYYQPGAAATPAAGGGCYYAERCDADGKCRSVYTCP